MEQKNEFSSKRFVTVLLVRQGEQGEEVFAAPYKWKSGEEEVMFPFYSVDVAEESINYSYLIGRINEQHGVSLPADRWQQVTFDPTPRACYGEGEGIVQAVLTAEECEVLLRKTIAQGARFIPFELAMSKAHETTRSLFAQRVGQ